MAESGKPLPFNLRLEIKAQRTHQTVREVARALQVSKTTVVKYTGNRGTK